MHLVLPLHVLSIAMLGAKGFAPPCGEAVIRSRSLLSATSSSSAHDTKRAPSVHDPASIRNVAFMGHSHAGKTTLAEWMMFDDHVLTKEPRSGTSVLDSDPVEANRHSSVFSHFLRVPHGNFLLEIADTPWGDFPSSALAACNGADSAVLVISAADGVQPGAIQAFQHCEQAGIKNLLAISKMDRPFCQVDQVLKDIEENFGIKPLPLQVPLGEGEDFQGVVPLFLVNEDGELQKNQVDGLDDAWTVLEETVAMTNDDLLVEYLEHAELQAEDVFDGLREAVIKGKILPLVYTSAQQDLGIVELADMIVAVLPDPLEMREDALKAVCENDENKDLMVPGVEAGFAARVLHTTVDSFGDLSIMRVISNSKNKNEKFEPLPSAVVNLRTGEKVKMPSTSAAFGLCGKERLPLEDEDHILPGDVLAVPKLPESVRTNDILTTPIAVAEEEAEISQETDVNHLSPLSRPAEDISLMTTATISVAATGSKKSRNKASSAKDDKLIQALAAMAREDLSLRVEHDAVTSKLIIRGMSSDHLHLVVMRLLERYGLEVELGNPPVQYRETLAKPVRNIEGRHKKQSGGSGQFGVCYISMEPLEEGAGVEFESQIKGGAIKKSFIASVEKGVREELLAGGPLAGYPVTDVKITVTDGKMHTVDSQDIAFQIAGKLAVKAALAQGKTRLLQPMERVTFLIDETMQGDINAIVARQEGYLTSSKPSQDGAHLEMEAILPSAAIPGVSNVLQLTSAGEGQFTTEFSHYQPVPDSQVADIPQSPSHR